MQSITLEELARHSKRDDLWIAVDGDVYDVTRFAAYHPGGAGLLVSVAGSDASDDFFGLHRRDVLVKYAHLKIGRLSTAGPEPAAAASALSLVPFAEAGGIMDVRYSPYWNESHRRFLLAVREFVDREIAPIAALSEERGEPPSLELFKKMGDFGLLAARLGPGAHLKDFPLPAGIKPEEFDHFHEAIATEELARTACPSFTDGLGTGLVIGLPPVMVFGRPELAKRVGAECLRGEKIICLAVSEAQAGSDVAQLTTRAVRVGDHFIVNGLKKWITNGSFADYFVTAVRTGGPGMKGISFLLIPRSDGVSTPNIHTAYGGAAGTSYVLFEDVRVPAANLLGEQDQGFHLIMYNFNHERWVIALGVVRAARAIVEECFKWSMQRKVFGKRLIDQPVIRAKLGHMVAQVESCHAWVERVTHQLDETPLVEQAKLAPKISLLKLQATRTSLFVSEQAVQIFGGRAITKTGMGQNIERFQRSIKFTAVYGGSEEILADMAMRMAIKNFPESAKL